MYLGTLYVAISLSQNRYLIFHQDVVNFLSAGNGEQNPYRFLAPPLFLYQHHTVIDLSKETPADLSPQQPLFLIQIQFPPPPPPLSNRDMFLPA